MSHMEDKHIRNLHWSTLEARIDHVTDTAIRKKWKKLPPSASHGSTREALSIARQQTRSRQGKGKSSQAVEQCVDGMLDRLQDRLPRIPYPPSTDESYFDHEANLNRVNKLAGQLNDNTSAIRLLKAQIAKEEQELRQEEDEVKRLKKVAIDEESAARSRTQHLHSLAKKAALDVNEIELVAWTEQEQNTTLLRMTMLREDPELAVTLAQLESHLESISCNTTNIENVIVQIEKAHNELQASTTNK